MNKDSKKDLTADIKQLDVVVLGVYVLGGDRKSVDTEDIAIKCHDLSPGMFSWRKYPDQINLELVRVALSDAKKRQNGILIQGSGKDGWRLTSRGLDWIQRVGKRLLEGKVEWNQERRQSGSVDSRRIDREKHRVRISRAWTSWIERREISVIDAQNLFRIDSYSTIDMSESKIVRLQSLFELDKEISLFLQQAAKILKETRQEDNE